MLNEKGGGIMQRNLDKDDIFEKFDFIRLTRKNTKFHYGYIDTNIEKAKN